MPSPLAASQPVGATFRPVAVLHVLVDRRPLGLMTV